MLPNVIPMSIVVFGATGHLGRHVLTELRAGGIAPGEIVAAGRDLSKVDDPQVRTARVDYSDASSIRDALAGAPKVLLISSFDFGVRVAQHSRVIEAARDEGVELLAYTSTPYADTSTMKLAEDHRATEEVLRRSGVPYVMLRNSTYLEVFTEQMLPEYLRLGVIYGASGDGRISAATRGDLAAAAAVVLTSDGHAGAVYELGGDDAFTMPDLAALLTARTGSPVEYQDMPTEGYEKHLLDQGVPAPFAAIAADTQLGIARDEFFVPTGDLSRLIGRPTRSLETELP